MYLKSKIYDLFVADLLSVSDEPRHMLMSGRETQIKFLLGKYGIERGNDVNSSQRAADIADLVEYGFSPFKAGEIALDAERHHRNAILLLKVIRGESLS